MESIANHLIQHRSICTMELNYRMCNDALIVSEVDLELIVHRTVPYAL